MAATFEMVAKTMYGLEEILAGELIALGANDVQLGRRMVSFTGDKELLYKANFHCRTALRILKPIYHFKAKDADTVYKEVKKIPWENYITLDKTFAIDSVVHSEDFNHSKFVAYRTKDAIVDYFMEKEEKRPSVRVNNPDLYINIHISHNDCTISIDSSGESLHKGGYRVEQTEAPLNEVLAAGMILKTGWKGESNFIDPMCGSGTLLIEAAMIALNIAPGIHRKEFAFEKWVDFDQEMFDRIYNDESNEREFTFKCYGSDISTAAIEIAQKNVRSAGLAKYIELKAMPFQQYTEIPKPAIMVTNPPYGERISSRDLMGLYSMIGERMKHVFTGCDVWIISYKDECFDKIGLRPNEKMKLLNGSLECEYRCYNIFEGKNKDFKKALYEREERPSGERREERSGKPFRKPGRPDGPIDFKTARLDTPERRFAAARKREEEGEVEDFIPGKKIFKEKNMPVILNLKTVKAISVPVNFQEMKIVPLKNLLKRKEEMTIKNSCLTLLLVSLFLFPVHMMSQQTQLTIHDLIPGGKTYPDFVPATLKQLKWCGEEYIYVEGNDLLSARPGKPAQVILSLSELNDRLGKEKEDIRLSGMPVFSVPYEKEPVLSFVEKGERFHYDLKQGAIVARYTLPKEGKNYEFSSGSSFIAFTEGNNIRILSPDNRMIEVTQDTAKHVVYGQAVHQREFGIYKGLFWSPSGKKLAFYRMDESMVTDYPIVNIDTRIAQAEPYKYPMAGMKSHEVTVGIYDVASGETVWLKTGEPKEKYLTNIAWSLDEKSLYIAELNRDQNECRLIRYDVATGEKELQLFTESKNTYVEPQHPVQFVPGHPDTFIWQSERDGFNHIYLYDTTGKLLKQLTTGSWVVTDVLGFDPKGETLFYRSTAAHPDDLSGNRTALENHTWKVNLKTGKQECITPKPGVHQLLLSPDRTYALDIFSSPAVPREIDLIDLKTKKTVALLQAEDPFKNYTLPEIEVGQLKAADGVTDLNYRLVKPARLDAGKKYPVIIYVYGGPHSQLINGSWQYGTRGWDLYMAQQDVIVFTVDGRGSANRGHAFESAIFRHLGVNEMADQIQGVEFLKTLPYVDQERIGVHGWSYGGFMTTNLMLTYPDLFKVGVAGGPVIDWSQYEIMYGERYMDHPEDNPEGYKNANLKLKAGNLKGRLLLIHGDIDPVVVWQHSLGFLKACIEADTYPDYFVYPRHPRNVIGKDRPHLYEKITRYFNDYL